MKLLVTTQVGTELPVFVVAKTCTNAESLDTSDATTDKVHEGHALSVVGDVSGGTSSKLAQQQ